MKDRVAADITMVGIDEAPPKGLSLVAGCDSEERFVITSKEDTGKVFCPVIKGEVYVNNGTCTEKNCSNNFKSLVG